MNIWGSEMKINDILREALTKQWNSEKLMYPSNLCVWGALRHDMGGRRFKEVSVFQGKLYCKAGSRNRKLPKRDKLGRFCR